MGYTGQEVHVKYRIDILIYSNYRGPAVHIRYRTDGAQGSMQDMLGTGRLLYWLKGTGQDFVAKHWSDNIMLMIVEYATTFLGQLLTKVTVFTHQKRRPLFVANIPQA